MWRLSFWGCTHNDSIFFSEFDGREGLSRKLKKVRANLMLEMLKRKNSEGKDFVVCNKVFACNNEPDVLFIALHRGYLGFINDVAQTSWPTCSWWHFPIILICKQSPEQTSCYIQLAQFVPSFNTVTRFCLCLCATRSVPFFFCLFAWGSRENNSCVLFGIQYW